MTIIGELQMALIQIPHIALHHPEKSIKGKLLRWISNFLRQRKQRVLIDGEVSEEPDVTFSVPEGTEVGTFD